MGQTLSIQCEGKDGGEGKLVLSELFILAKTKLKRVRNKVTQ